MKAVLHVSRPEQWPIAVGNCKNLKAAVPEATAEVVVNAAAVTLFREPTPPLLEQLDALSSLSVAVKLCRNALKANQIPEESLPAQVTVIPAGIVELLERQAEGYAYVSP